MIHLDQAHTIHWIIHIDTVSSANCDAEIPSPHDIWMVTPKHSDVHYDKKKHDNPLRPNVNPRNAAMCNMSTARSRHRHTRTKRM